MTVPVLNRREISPFDLGLDKSGFFMLPHPYGRHIDSKVEDEIVKTYYQEVCELVKRMTEASKAVAFDHNIR